MPRPDGEPAATPELPPTPERPLAIRLAWMAGIWLASVAFLAAIAAIIRFWLGV